MKNKKWISLAAAVVLAVTALPAGVFAAKRDGTEEKEEKEEEKAVCGSKIWDIFSSSAVGDTFISSFAGNRVFLDGQSWPERLCSKAGGCPGTDAGFFRIGE